MGLGLGLGLGSVHLLLQQALRVREGDAAVDAHLDHAQLHLGHGVGVRVRVGFGLGLGLGLVRRFKGEGMLH